jgi:hypothetical protein
MGQFYWVLSRFKYISQDKKLDASLSAEISFVLAKLEAPENRLETLINEPKFSKSDVI